MLATLTQFALEESEDSKTTMSSYGPYLCHLMDCLTAVVHVFLLFELVQFSMMMMQIIADSMKPPKDTISMICFMYSGAVTFAIFQSSIRVLKMIFFREFLGERPTESHSTKTPVVSAKNAARCDTRDLCNNGKIILHFLSILGDIIHVIKSTLQDSSSEDDRSDEIIQSNTNSTGTTDPMDLMGDSTKENCMKCPGTPDSIADTVLESRQFVKPVETNT
jgi:hypothetical protein